ncbi:HAMP domain-containing sensor histidine kinase [Microbispora corallina]|uniref:histidine kinase n=1 Tax=Microbispora corallina TaxID=83302 RepID=A0ABQ4G7K7_9ACTN|nr:HAMP domain-containing sensor histidine kinase [Microbispora corallina]GIH43034.1 sensor protein CutS [Microbispora corallina]
MIRLRNGTVGLRFTILYAGVFLMSGIGLLALAFLFSGEKVTRVAPGQGPAGDGGVHDLPGHLADAGADHSRQILIGSALALVVMAAVSLVVGRVLARRVLRPLRLITAATRRISADNLHERLGVSGPADEVKDLADTVDGLLERLETSFAAQRRFVANASHELRTPLATMRASLDVAVAKPGVPRQTLVLGDRLRVQLDLVDRLLDGLLVLARAEHGALARSPDADPQVDVDELVARALTGRGEEIAASRLTVTSDLGAGTAIRGDAALLARMVGNVVDNAVTHNEEGGWIRVETFREAAEVRLVVQTGGRVLDQRDVDRLARPFERLGADRTGSDNGSGLGLSIVAAIAAAHGGRLDLLARPRGGLRVSVALPAVPAGVPA